MKNTALTLALTLILTILLYTVAEIQFAYETSAQYSELVISIRDYGSIDPSTAPIQRIGDVYNVTSDINCNTILIQRDNVVFDGANHAIELFGSFDLTEQENVTVKNTVIRAGLGICLSGSNNKIIGNTFHINATNAIAISYIGYKVTSGNIISSNIIELKNGHSGVDVFKALDTVISNNTIFTAEDSLQVLGGIIITSSHNTTVIGNSINAYATYGIAVLKYLDSSPQGETLSSVVGANSITGNYSYGVYSNCPNVDIVGNNITGELQKNPDGCGIMLRQNSNNNIVSQNYVVNNGYGIYFQPFLNNSVKGILRFSVFENSFVNNTIQAKISMANCSINWDNAKRGNYWSDYVGEDADDDGIGEAPYIIDGENNDNYPLMAPFEILPSPEPQPMDSFPTTLIAVSIALVAVAGIGVLVYFKKRKH
jgi:parallel beta-helix repeat protein